MNHVQQTGPSDELDLLEVEAVDQLRKGKIAGLQYLVEKFELMAVRAAVLITCDRGLAEEIVQEAFIRAFKRIHQFQNNRPFSPWFIRSVVNAALRATQVRNRHTFLDPTKIAELVSSRNSNGKSPEAAIMKAETHQEVWQALQSLPPEQRAILVQRYYRGLGVKEISGCSGEPSGTIKWRLSEARKKLKGVLIINRTLARESGERGEGK